MAKSSDYDEKIALYEKQLKELKEERCKLRRKEARTEARRKKYQEKLLKLNYEAVKAQCEAMEEWLRRKRPLASGKFICLWDKFVHDYPQYNYHNPLYDDGLWRD